MTKRLRRSFIVCALLTAMTMCVVVFFGVYGFVQRQTEDALRTQTAALAAMVEASPDPVALLNGSVFDHRVTLVDAGGEVLYDSSHDIALMDNHLHRPEIQSALAAGEGASRRASDTAGDITLYYALHLGDGSVLRLGADQVGILGTVKSVSLWLVGGALVCAALAMVLAVPVTARIVRPINAINLERPLESDAYEELTPMLRRMDQQNARIAGQLESLSAQRRQLDVILGGMREGIIILDGRHTVLTINDAARDILAVSGEAVGHTMLAVNRSDALVRLLSQGSGESEMLLRGRTIHVSISAVAQGGMVILFQDVTAARLAEESRRQFSANVSHELRTPLTTISGYAELLASGMARPQDAGMFGEKILAESRRLLTLIEDIIRLSRLDEGAAGEMLPVDLLALARTCADKLSPSAQRAQVDMQVEGDEVRVTGERALLEEMLTNLMENGVKYNHPGGRVIARVGRKDGRPFMQVEDNGVGIAPEHQSRVFERFYRVDKSRSKQTGGTGLGLSIVKHGAQTHGADVTLSSAVGQGTTITVTFPRDAQVS